MRQEIANRINALRESKNWSYGEAAVKMGIDRGTFRNWCVGKSLPDAEELSKVLEFFNVQDVRAFLGLSPAEIQTTKVDKTHEKNDSFCELLGRYKEVKENYAALVDKLPDKATCPPFSSSPSSCCHPHTSKD